VCKRNERLVTLQTLDQSTRMARTTFSKSEAKVSSFPCRRAEAPSAKNNDLGAVRDETVDSAGKGRGKRAAVGTASLVSIGMSARIGLGV
jgi:hypothetical protein